MVVDTCLLLAATGLTQDRRKQRHSLPAGRRRTVPLPDQCGLPNSAKEK